MPLTSWDVVLAGQTRPVAIRLIGGKGFQAIEPPVSTFPITTAATTNATSIASTAAVLRGAQGINLHTYAVYLNFHNVAGTPTPGSGVVFKIVVQAGEKIDPSEIPAGGREFSTGLGLTITKFGTPGDTTPVELNKGIFEILYHDA